MIEEDKEGLVFFTENKPYIVALSDNYWMMFKSGRDVMIHISTQA